jgi:hypothetical protein
MRLASPTLSFMPNLTKGKKRYLLASYLLLQGMPAQAENQLLDSFLNNKALQSTLQTIDDINHYITSPSTKQNKVNKSLKRSSASNNNRDPQHKKLQQWFDFTKVPSTKSQLLLGKQLDNAISPWKGSIYQERGTPIADLQFYGLTNKEGGHAGFSVLAEHKLGLVDTQFFLSRNKNEDLNGSRLTFSQDNIKNSASNFFNIRQYQVGDITPIKTTAGNTQNIGKGVSFSNQSSKELIGTRSITFSDNIQPGWEVELYRNGILIERLISEDNGRYDFKDIELLFGSNQFKLIFYGPQGQVKTQTKQVYVNKNSLNAKQKRYAFSIVDLENKLFSDATENPDSQLGWLSTLNYNQGITPWISAHSSLNYLKAEQDDDKKFYSLGLSAHVLPGLLVSADFSQNDQSKEKVLVKARSKMGKQAFNLSYQKQNKDFWITPVQTNSTTQLSTEQQMKILAIKPISYNLQTLESLALIMQGNLLQRSNLSINYQNDWAKRQYENNLKTEIFTNQLYLFSGKSLLSHQLSWLEYDEEGRDKLRNLTGFLRMQHSFGLLHTRLQTGYEVQPDNKITHLRGDFSYPLQPNLHSELDLGYYPIDAKYRIRLGLNWQYDVLSLNSSLFYNSDDIWSAGLTAKFTFGYDPKTDRYYAHTNKTKNNNTTGSGYPPKTKTQNNNATRNNYPYANTAQNSSAIGRDYQRPTIASYREDDFDKQVINALDIASGKAPFKRGYFLEIGTFDTKKAMKSYWYNMIKAYNNVLRQKMFYTFDPHKKTFNLNAAYFDNKLQARQACHSLSVQAIDCQANYFQLR